MSDHIIDATEYGVGKRYHLGARRTDGTAEALTNVPDHLVGFARAELRDRLGTSDVEFVIRGVS